MLACFQRAPWNIDGTVRFSPPNMAGAISSRLKKMGDISGLAKSFYTNYTITAGLSEHSVF